MQQNTDKWLEWRRQGIGASDAPIIMGVSPYKTKHQLWLEKTGQSNEKVNNWAMQRGTDLEPKARAHYEILNNRSMPATLAQHKDHSFLRASLDGFDGETVLEIKCPGKDDHTLAMAGKVPEKYYPQLQHQLMVTGAKECHYFSFDGEKGVNVIVVPDAAYIANLLDAERIFWQHVLDNTPPPMGDKDFKTVESDEVKTLLREWDVVDSMFTQSSKRRGELNDKIYELTKDMPKRLEADNMQIIRSERKGNIDYSSIPNLRGVNLDAYRKAPSEVFTIKRSDK